MICIVDCFLPEEIYHKNREILLAVLGAVTSDAVWNK